MNKIVSLFSVLSAATIATNSVAMQNIAMIMSKDKTAYYTIECSPALVS